MQLDDAVQKYNAASKHYDRLMDVVFGSLLDLERQRERIVGLLGDLAGATVLDVGCGTGRNFPLLTRCVGPRGRVIGIDCSPGMLAQAGRLVERHGWSNVELLLGDAVKLDGVPEPVDAVISAWCYGTVYDVGGALERAVDVLRPGGHIAILTFTRAAPEHGPLRWLYPFYRFAVQCAGIDTAEDFDNASLQARWERGRRVLRARLNELHEERYLQGAGLIIAGRKPREAVAAAAGRAAQHAVHDGRAVARLGERAAMP
jgi:ubiquinone/menaquinone biosynthesis C-methylase UbiE